MMVSLGPWQWRTDRGPASWNPPDGAIASLDLRSVTHCAIPGPIAQGSGLFVSDVALPAEYTTLASDPDEVVTDVRKTVLRDTLGLPRAITSGRLSDIVYELMTEHSDPDIGVICPPLMPNHQGALVFVFDRIRRFSQFSDQLPEWKNIQKVLHANYRHYRDEQQAGLRPKDFHRRILSVWMESYKIADFTKFIPSDLPKDETPLEHHTSQSENFNQGDSTTVGPQLSWTEIVEANWSTLSNQLITATDAVNDTRIRANADVSSADHFAQIECIGIGAGSGAGPCARYASAADTCYHSWFYTGDNNIYFSKVVTGTRTNLTSTGQAFSAPDTMKLESVSYTHLR